MTRTETARSLPVVVCQVLLHLGDPTQFVEEPLVYGRQLVDAIDTHAAVKGLNRRGGTDSNLTVIFINAHRSQVSHTSSKVSNQMLMKTWR